MRKFHQYDVKKQHGHIFNPASKLYQNIHLTNQANYQIISEDLRCKLNLFRSEIPIMTGLILDIDTFKIRTRTDGDYFTYEIEYPIYNPHLSNYIRLITGDNYTIIKKFIRQSLTSSGNLLLISGHTDKLFNLLLSLNPLIMIGHKSLWCEQYASLKYFQDIETAKIILVDLGDRTVRRAQVKSKLYTRTLQFNSLVKTSSTSAIPIYDVVDENFTAGELLEWIIT